jgi:hypothetical protein
LYSEELANPESEDKQETTAWPVAVISGLSTLSLRGPIELKPDMSSCVPTE